MAYFMDELEKDSCECDCHECGCCGDKESENTDNMKNSLEEKD